ncbi:hypothetical protein D3C85_703680 [compost metagenome]
MLDDLHRPVLRQLQVLAELAFSAQQTGNVGVLGALGGFLDVLRVEAQFFRVDHGEQGPAHDVEPLLVTLAHGRAEGLLGDHFRQHHVLVRRGQLDALGIELGLVGGQHVATTGLQRLGALVGGVVGDGGVLEVVGAEVVGQVQLGGGAGLDADGGAIEFLGAGNAEFLVHQEALTVVVGHAGEVQAHGGVAGAGPGAVARQDIHFAGLQRGETFLGRQRAVLDLAGIAEHSGGDSTADIDVDALVVALAIGIGEAREAVTDAALHVAFLLHRVQGGARLCETADTENGCRGQHGQGGFHHLH